MTHAIATTSAADAVTQVQYRLDCLGRAVTPQELLVILGHLDKEARRTDASFMPKLLQELYRDALERSLDKKGGPLDGPYSIIGLQWALDRIMMDFAANEFTLTAQ